MRDNLRRYHAIRRALIQEYPATPKGKVARHLTAETRLCYALLSFIIETANKFQLRCAYDDAPTQSRTGRSGGGDITQTAPERRRRGVCAARRGRPGAWECPPL